MSTAKYVDAFEEAEFIVRNNALLTLELWRNLGTASFEKDANEAGKKLAPMLASYITELAWNSAPATILDNLDDVFEKHEFTALFTESVCTDVDLNQAFREILGDNGHEIYIDQVEDFLVNKRFICVTIPGEPQQEDTQEQTHEDQQQQLPTAPSQQDEEQEQEEEEHFTKRNKRRRLIIDVEEEEQEEEQEQQQQTRITPPLITKASLRANSIASLANQLNMTEQVYLDTQKHHLQGVTNNFQNFIATQVQFLQRENLQTEHDILNITLKRKSSAEEKKKNNNITTSTATILPDRKSKLKAHDSISANHIVPAIYQIQDINELKRRHAFCPSKARVKQFKHLATLNTKSFDITDFDKDVFGYPFTCPFCQCNTLTEAQRRNEERQNLIFQAKVPQDLLFD